MNLIFSFIFSVLASIVAYYICKWLDRKQQLVASLGLNPPFQNGQKAPEVQLRGFCCINHEYISSFIAYRHYSICSSGMQYSKIEKIVIYFISCRTQSGNRKGVNRLDLITSFLVSVMAGVVSYYICKWLDRNDSDNQPKESPRGCDSGAFALCTTWIQILSQLLPLQHMQLRNAIFPKRKSYDILMALQHPRENGLLWHLCHSIYPCNAFRTG